MSDYYDLGAYGRSVYTSSDDAQLWFDRGLNWCYGFNHDESVRCFERAAEHDLDLALARAEVPIKASCYCRLEHAA